MTKQELIKFIKDYITTNGQNEVSGAIQAAVLIEMVNSIFESDGLGGIPRFKGLATVTTNPGNPDTTDIYIAKVEPLSNQVFTFFNKTVNAGELVLFKRNGAVWDKLVIGMLSGGSGGTLTATQIRDALQSLLSTNRLNKSAILGADFALNYRGKANVLDSQTMSGITYISPYDFWIANGITETASLKNGDWIVAIDVTLPIDPNEYNDPSIWMILPFHVLSGAEIVTKLQGLSDLNRLTKSAVRGADFSLNRRGKGNILDPSFSSSISNVLKGDFWIYSDTDPTNSEYMSFGDWVIAMRDGITYPFNFQDPADWQIVHFGDTSVQQQTLDLHHYRITPAGETEYITIFNVHAQVVSMCINHLTYFGKYNDGNYNGYDFMYSYDGANTVITINSGMLGFNFMNSMQVDVLYILIPQ